MLTAAFLIMSSPLDELQEKSRAFCLFAENVWYFSLTFLLLFVIYIISLRFCQLLSTIGISGIQNLTLLRSTM